MSVLDLEATAAARAANPTLSVFDTGEMLEPTYAYGLAEKRDGYWKTGTVDFDNDEGATVFTIFAHPSTIDDDTTLIQIDTLAGDKFRIMLNDGTVYFGNPQREAEDDTMCWKCWGIIPPEGVTMVPDDGELCDCKPESALVEKLIGQYDANQAEYDSHPEDEQVGKVYETYEDNLIELSHALIHALRKDTK
ncbi:hypothetical protein [Frigoribacterium sp. CG_9.8]|uniref:hypothetical protein n=1 Tax=Frigoribacterium sp. CG_9.8 TaxID=2787733 RepID=UPI0018CB8E91|nr:hypothetical protein [Frigoribacterium sp. CG_9.8]MBG6106597.1 hypothetical protein [Frigoribacterium sp. CG_9.8]